MGRSASSIYYHVHRLVEVGLLRESGRGGRGEVLYEAVRSTVELSPDDGGSADAILRTMSAAFRMAERDLEAALPAAASGEAEPRVSATRLHFRASPEVLVASGRGAGHAGGTGGLAVACGLGGHRRGLRGAGPPGPTSSRWVAPPLAILGSVVLFGLAHAYQGPRGMARTGAIGLVLAGLYAATGTLLAPMALHTVLDVTSGTLGYLALKTPVGPRSTPA